MFEDFFWRSSASRFPLNGYLIIGLVSILSILGLIALFSASQAMHENPLRLVQKQLIWVFIAIFFSYFAYRLDLEKLRIFIPFIGGISLLLLLVVLIPGFASEINGSKRWINLGFMKLQVSEIGKIGLLLTLSNYLANNRRVISTFRRGLFYPFCILGSYVIAIFLEPDYGTSFLCGLIGSIMIFVSGIKLRYIVPFVFIALVLFSIAVFLNPERFSRVTSFLDLESNKMDSGYQLYQSIIAFGVGGLDGVGLGNGQQQMSFLPEAHTDFIFSIIAEELGLFVTLGVVFIYLILFILVITNLKFAPNLYQYLLVLGSILLIEFQAIINIGVVTGCLPTKGLSLPFISYGGSNIVLMFTLIALILNCFVNWEKVPLKLEKEL